MTKNDLTNLCDIPIRLGEQQQKLDRVLDSCNRNESFATEEFSQVGGDWSGNARSSTSTP